MSWPFKITKEQQEIWDLERKLLTNVEARRNKYTSYYIGPEYIYMRHKGTHVLKKDGYLYFYGCVYLHAKDDKEKHAEYSNMSSRFPLVGRKVMDDVNVRIPDNLICITNT